MKPCCVCGKTDNEQNPQYTNNIVCIVCVPVKTFSEMFREEQK